MRNKCGTNTGYSSICSGHTGPCLSKKSSPPAGVSQLLLSCPDILRYLFQAVCHRRRKASTSLVSGARPSGGILSARSWKDVTGSIHINCSKLAKGVCMHRFNGCILKEPRSELGKFETGFNEQLQSFLQVSLGQETLPFLRINYYIHTPQNTV